MRRNESAAAAAAAARKMLDAAATRERKNAARKGVAAAAPFSKDARISPSGPRVTAGPPSTVGGFTGARSCSGLPQIHPNSIGGPNSIGSSRFPPHTISSKAQWMQSSSDPSNWEDIPLGGLSNYLQNDSQLFPENFHHVGVTCNEGQLHGSPSVEPTGTPDLSQQNVSTPVDNEEGVRIVKKLNWTPEEDARLMSAWLKCSLDSIDGNDKKNEQYWKQVKESYNKTTPAMRKRTVKQIKDRWHKINKLADLFHSAYLKARRIFTSGYNDEKWIAEAQILYEADNKLGRFNLLDVWYAIRNEPKWQTYNDGLKRKRKEVEQGAEQGTAEDDFDLTEIPRPPGQKQAKKAAYESKLKEAKSCPPNEELQILKQSQAMRMKAMEVQEKVAKDKLETARLNHEAAKKNVEARNLEIRSKMLDTYNCLLVKDVSLMTEEQRLDHVGLLKHLKNTLYPTID